MHFFENPGTLPYKRGGTVTGKTQTFSWTVNEKDGQRRYRYTARLQASPSPQKNQHKPFHAYKHNSKQNGSKLVCPSKPGRLERFYVNKPRPRACRPTPCTARTRCNLPTLFSAKTGPYTNASYVQKETM